MVLVLDNYDSFTYNLVQILNGLGAETVVRRNDTLTVEEALALRPSAVVVSPGPCTPSEAGISVALIRAASDRCPVLGVCLGHQSVAAAFGGRVVRAPEPVHGKVSEVHHDGRTVYRGLDAPFPATRYHSLVVERETLPDCLEVSAWTGDGLVMGLRHREKPVEGVQFHPESVLTKAGGALIANFLRMAGRPERAAQDARESGRGFRAAGP
jgi:anthranilate synthase/aminodeoxychorismate synthase-like glutamine amidotransferase